jgi:hypothetical protein
MQLELPIVDEEFLRLALENVTGMSVQLIITNNRSSMLSFKPTTSNSAQVRVHQMFLSAEPDVIRALGLWLKRTRCKRSGAIIDDFIRDHRHLIADRKARRQRQFNTLGRLYDLQSMYDEINNKHFSNTIDVPICWGKLPSKRNRRSIRFGSFTPEDNLIRIHPYLDQDFVPEFFVRYILFHEMLHAHLGIDVHPSGRRIIHSKTFNRMEREYPDYQRAIAWHDSPKNLHKLLRAPRRRAA